MVVVMEYLAHLAEGGVGYMGRGQMALPGHLGQTHRISQQAEAAGAVDLTARLVDHKLGTDQQLPHLEALADFPVVVAGVADHHQVSTVA